MHNRVESTAPEVDLYRIPLQYITDYKEGVSIPEQVEAVCKGGCRWVQLRMKEADREEFIRVGRTVKEICKRHGALFLVNDNVDIALELDADGVHLGKEDMNPLEARRILGYSKIIGGTCNTFEDVVTRFRQQVDYIGLGPFTYTSTKSVSARSSVSKVTERSWKPAGKRASISPSTPSEASGRMTFNRY